MKTTSVTVDNHNFLVEVADTFFSRMQGLAWRDQIACDGVLFVFPFRRRWPVWMLGMRFAIDLIWLDDWEIIGMERNIAAPKNLKEAITFYRPPKPIDMALELVANNTTDKSPSAQQ